MVARQWYTFQSSSIIIPIIALTWQGLPARSNIAKSSQGCVPNPHRPPNPFTPSCERDWVVVGDSSNGSDHWQSKTHVGQAPTIPERDARAYSPRDQPLSEYIHVDGIDTAANGAPLVRIDSVASSTSSAAAVRRKPAPPVPKKPYLLTSNSPQVPLLAANAPALGTKRLPDPAPLLVGWNKSVNSGSLPATRPSSGVNQRNSGHVSVSVRLRFDDTQIQNETDAMSRPSNPARPMIQTQSGTGLMDEDSNEDQVRDIPSLQPLRPR